MELTSRQVTLASLGGGVLSLVLALVSGNAWLAVIASILLFLSLVFFRLGAVLVPFLLHGLRIVETRGGWRLDGDVAVLQDGSRFLASAFVEVDVSASPSLLSADQAHAHTLAFERALCSLHFPTQFSLTVFPLDTEAYREQVLTDRLETEMALRRLQQGPKPDAAVLARFERKLGMCRGLLEKLASGVRPMEAVYTVGTTAEGTSEVAAAEKARYQARELRATLSNAFGLIVRPATGETLSRALDWRMAIPPSREAYVEGRA